MEERSLAILVKAWAVLCAIVGVYLVSEALLTWMLVVMAFCQLFIQCRIRLALSFGVFYLLLVLLLYLIRFHGMHMVVFSEFHVLMFFNLMPVFITAWDLIFSYYESRAAGCASIHEKPTFDWSCADPASSGCHL